MDKLKLCKIRMFKVIGLVFILTIAVTFCVLLSQQTAMAGNACYSDIPVDHPAYRCCKNLISSGAVSSGWNKAFRPFAAITAKEWNYALARLSEASGQTVHESLKFVRDSEITKESLRKRFLSLSNDDVFDAEVFDCSRFSVFYTLEECFFKAQQ